MNPKDKDRLATQVIEAVAIFMRTNGGDESAMFTAAEREFPDCPSHVLHSAHFLVAAEIEKPFWDAMAKRLNFKPNDDESWSDLAGKLIALPTSPKRGGSHLDDDIPF